MTKAILLTVVGLVLLAGSCYDWSRVSEPGVLTQETCADNPVPGCKNPEDFADDPVTGERKMWAGKPNDEGWVMLIAGVLVLLYAAYSGYQAHENRKIVGARPLTGIEDDRL